MEGLFGHIKDEFSAQGLKRLRVVQGQPRGLHRPLEHAEEAGQTERTDPGGIPEPVLAGGVAADFN